MCNEYDTYSTPSCTIHMSLFVVHHCRLRSNLFSLILCISLLSLLLKCHGRNHTITVTVIISLMTIKNGDLMLFSNRTICDGNDDDGDSNKYNDDIKYKQ